MTERLGQALGKFLEAGDLIGLIGELGGGKTCFVRGVAEGLAPGRGAAVHSPSFIIAQVYSGEPLLCHLDLYRLTDLEELQTIGYEEYYFGQGICIVEWIDRVPEAIPAERLLIDFTVSDIETRDITLSARGRRYVDLLGRLTDALGLGLFGKADD